MVVVVVVMIVDESDELGVSGDEGGDVELVELDDLLSLSEHAAMATEATVTRNIRRDNSGIPESCRWLSARLTHRLTKVMQHGYSLVTEFRG